MGTRFGHDDENDRFHDQRLLDKAKWTSEKQIRCADAQWDIVHGSKNLFKEQYYTDTRGYNTGREDCRQYQAEIMCISMTVYFQYLKIHKFVWARVLCDTRYYKSASLDCSGIIQKIHMREIEWGQGSGMMMKMTDFMIRGC